VYSLDSTIFNLSRPKSINQWENNIPADLILLKTLLNNDDTKLESLASLELFDASTG